MLSGFADRDYIYVLIILTIFQLESVLTNKTAVLNAVKALSDLVTKMKL